MEMERGQRVSVGQSQRKRSEIKDTIGHEIKNEMEKRGKSEKRWGERGQWEALKVNI